MVCVQSPILDNVCLSQLSHDGSCEWMKLRLLIVSSLFCWTFKLLDQLHYSGNFYEFAIYLTFKCNLIGDLWSVYDFGQGKNPGSRIWSVIFAQSPILDKEKKSRHRDLIGGLCPVSDVGPGKNAAAGFDRWFVSSLRSWTRYLGMSFSAELQGKLWNIRLYSVWYPLYVLRVSL